MTIINGKKYKHCSVELITESPTPFEFEWIDYNKYAAKCGLANNTKLNELVKLLGGAGYCDKSFHIHISFGDDNGLIEVKIQGCTLDNNNYKCINLNPANITQNKT